MTGVRPPWNASWTGELRFEVRPCRWVGGKLAVWSPHAPGEGEPVFAKPHMVRQRRSIAEMRCTVCGEKTPPNDRWWFGLGRSVFEPVMRGEVWMTTEAPVHGDCADLARKVCPHLRSLGAEKRPFPDGYSILSAIVGGPNMANDFGLFIPPHRTVIGHLKIAWPIRTVRSDLLRLDRP